MVRVAAWPFVLLFWVASAVLGWEIGWLTGHTGPDATVLAAVLPAMLSAVAAGVGLVTVRASVWVDESNSLVLRCRVTVVATAAIMFVGAMHVGVGQGVDHGEKQLDDFEQRQLNRLEIQEKAEVRKAVARVERIYEYLESCRGVRDRINEFRKDVELKALTLGQACPAIVVSTVDPVGERIVQNVVDVLLEPEALEKHERYLEGCTLGQLAGEANVLLVEVCPLLER